MREVWAMLVCLLVIDTMMTKCQCPTCDGTCDASWRNLMKAWHAKLGRIVICFWCRFVGHKT